MSIQDISEKIAEGRRLVGEDGNPAYIKEKLEKVNVGTIQQTLGDLIAQAEVAWDKTADLTGYAAATDDNTYGALNLFLTATEGSGNPHSTTLVDAAVRLNKDAKQLCEAQNERFDTLTDAVTSLRTAATYLEMYVQAHNTASARTDKVADGQATVVAAVDTYLADIGQPPQTD